MEILTFFYSHAHASYFPINVRAKHLAFATADFISVRVTLKLCNIRRISSLGTLDSPESASESVESSSIGWHEASGSTNRETGARQAAEGQRGVKQGGQEDEEDEEEEEEEDGRRTWLGGRGGRGRGASRFSMVKSRSARGRSAVADEPRLCKVPRRAARAALQRDRQTAHWLRASFAGASNQDIKKARNSWLHRESAVRE